MPIARDTVYIVLVDMLELVAALLARASQLGLGTAATRNSTATRSRQSRMSLEEQLVEAKALQLSYEAALIRKSEECHDLLHQLETVTVNYEALLLTSTNTSSAGGDHRKEGGESRKRFSISRFLTSSSSTSKIVAQQHSSSSQFIQQESSSLGATISSSANDSDNLEDNRLNNSQSIIVALESKVVDLERQSTEAETKIASLIATIIAEAQASAAFKTDMDSLVQAREDALNMIKSDHNDSHMRLGAALSDRDILRSRCEACELELANLTLELEGKDALLARLEVRVEEDSEQLTSLMIECDATKQLLAPLVRAEAKAAAAAEEHMQEIYEARERMLAVTAESESYKSALEGLQLALGDKEAKIGGLEQTVQEQAASIDRLSHECALRESDLLKAVADVSRLEILFSNLQAESQLQQQALQASKESTELATQRAVQAECSLHRLSQLQEQGDKHSADANRLKKIVDSQASELKKIVKETALKAQQYEQALLRKSDECHSLLEELEALHRELNSMEASPAVSSQQASTSLASGDSGKRRFSLGRFLKRRDDGDASYT